MYPIWSNILVIQSLLLLLLFLWRAEHSSLTWFCFPSEVDEVPPSSSRQEVAQAEGFGKLYPSARPSEQQDEHSEDEQDLASGVISRKELEKGRLSRDGKHNPLKQRGGGIAAPSPSPGKGGASYWCPFCLQLTSFSHFYMGLCSFHSPAQRNQYCYL